MDLQNNRPYYRAFYDFGTAFLTPLLSVYIRSLLEQLEDRIPVCLAREGWLIQAALNTLSEQKLINLSKAPVYLKVSRLLLFRCLLSHPISWPIALSSTFDGNLEVLLRDRFGLRMYEYNRICSAAELKKFIKLPRDQEVIEQLFKKNIDVLRDISHDSSLALVNYLNSIGLMQSKSPLCFLDLGYSGTIQKLLTYILEQDTDGLYFIALNPGIHEISKYKAKMRGVFKEDIRFGKGDYFLDRSIFMECLFTCGEGSVIDISESPNKTFNFYYGHNTSSQYFFQDLQAIFDGAIDGLIDVFKRGYHYSIAEVDELMVSFLRSPDALPNALYSLFNIDNTMNGKGMLNSKDYFMPQEMVIK